MTHHLQSALAAAFAGAIAAGSIGCNALDCGPGTIERDGACVPADVDPDDATCGEGTVLGTDGTCVPEVIVVCDPDTTREEVNPTTGVVTCVGTTGQGCAADLQCPAPTMAGRLTVCGRLLDTQTNEPLAESGATGDECPATPTADGPCSISLTFVDALEFAMNPSSLNPHPPRDFFMDDCGRYVAQDIAPSSFGFLGIAIDDAMGTSDRHKLTGVAMPDAEAQPARGFPTYVTRNETDAAWSTGMGTSFATRGVIAFIFRRGGQPVAGVQVRREGQPITADDYYFSDPTGATRDTVAPAQAMTGANGTALVVNPASGQPSNYDAVGGLPGGCLWPTALAAAIPGVVFVQVKTAETTGGAECP